jgi:cysteine-rich repeat protein
LLDFGQRTRTLAGSFAGRRELGSVMGRSVTAGPIVCVLVAMGCGETATGGGDLGVETEGDEGRRGVDVQDDADRADAQATLTCPGASGCPCDDKTAPCDNGLCIETLAGNLCAKSCSGKCDAGFKCAQVPVGGDVVSICVPAWGRLCEPCELSKTCEEALAVSGALCVAYGGATGSFCGAPCQDDSDCPTGYACGDAKSTEGKAAKQCLRKPENTGAIVCPCSPRAVKLQLQTQCLAKSDQGSCNGIRACTAEGLGACTAPASVPETCNGEDDDCDGQTDEGLCDDKDPCTDDVCDGKQGVCLPLPNTAACDDQNACTGNDLCADKKCQGKAIDCDDKNPCTDDACDSAKGCTHNPHNKPCNDFNACTANDLCDGKGACLGIAVDVTSLCNDNNPCTADQCDPGAAPGSGPGSGPGGAAGCKNPAQAGTCEDGNPCTNGDACSDGACKPGENVCSCVADADCKPKEDGDLCNGTLYCNKAKAPFVCAVDPKTVVKCDTSKDTACSKAACDANTGSCGAVAEPAGKPCDADGSVCTTGDACKAGACDKGPAVDCDDKNPCTDDTCDPKSGCKQVNNIAACSDGNACTTGDTCGAGQCVPGKKSECDDSNPCTTDSCDKTTGKCVFDGTPHEGDPCDADQSVCTVADKCKAGKCEPGAKKSCDDGNVCTEDTCNPNTGCKYLDNTAPCEFDNNPCTPNDACKNGTCTLGPKKDCDDKNACTVDACDKANGNCVHAGEPLEKAACEDGDKCTASETCKAGKCGNGVAVLCDDKNPCTKDGCEAAKGCTHAIVADQTGCDDGEACTIKDICVAGNCKGLKLDCDDKNACTVDQCGPTGCLHSNLPDGKNPPEGPCAAGKYCVAGKCVTPGCGDGFQASDEQCDDGNAVACDGCEGCERRGVLQLDGNGFGKAGPGTLALDHDLTLEAWVRLDTLAQDAAVVAKGTAAGGGALGYALVVLKGAGVPAFQHKAAGVAAETVVGNTAVALKQWTHVAAVVVGDQVQLFVGGKAAGSGKLQQQRIDPAGSALAVGRLYPDATGSAVVGALDEVHVAAAALRGAPFVPERRTTRGPSTRALWRFDDAAGPTAADSGPLQHDLSLTTAPFAKDSCYGASADTAQCGDGKVAPLFEACDDGNALPCDGCESCRKQQHLTSTGGYVQVSAIAQVAADAFCPTCEMTVEAWVRPDATGQVGEIVGTSCGYLSLTLASGKFGLYRYPEALCAGTTIATPGKWYHVAATLGWQKGAVFKLWVDGKLDCQKTSMLGTIPPDALAEVLFLGAGGGGTGGGCVSKGETPKAGNPFPGAIDEVRVSQGLRYHEEFVPPRRVPLDVQTRGLWRFDGDLAAGGNETGTGKHEVKGAAQEPDKCYGELPTSVVCGDGEKARWEQCDSGTAGGPPPKKCSVVCTLNPEPDCTSIAWNEGQVPNAKNAMQYPVAGWALEGWVNLAKPPSGQVGVIAGVDATAVCPPMPKDQHWFVATKPDGTDATQLGGTNAIASTPKKVWKFGTWQHFALQFHGTAKGSLWVDGAQVRTFSNVPATWSASCPMRLGNSQQTTTLGYPVAAAMAGLKLSKQVRYGQPFEPAWTLKPDSLALFDWAFQEGSGTESKDLVLQYVMDLKGAAWGKTGPGCGL